MAKHTRIWNQKVFNMYVQTGRGQGEKNGYLPWIKVQDFSSHGMISRVHSYKTNRVHHFLSRNELYYFYILEWSDKVVDIREQYPLLNVELAMDIAREAGIKYPRDAISKFPYILTCDFMITTEKGLKARTIKNVKELSNDRTLEKLEIERRYWEYIGIDWRIVTEEEISMPKAREIEWLYTAAKLPEHLNKKEYTDAILKAVKEGVVFDALKTVEENFCLCNGSGLLILKYLIWNKVINFDISKIMSV